MTAVKVAGFGTGVNVTLGLPFPRVAPDHGTAFDIAGQGRADPGSMRAALELAAELARRVERAGAGAAARRESPAPPWSRHRCPPPPPAPPHPPPPHPPPTPLHQLVHPPPPVI